jgi:vacuolar-type H+-ATPase subunit I/STV1
MFGSLFERAKPTVLRVDSDEWERKFSRFADGGPPESALEAMLGRISELEERLEEKERDLSRLVDSERAAERRCETLRKEIRSLRPVAARAETLEKRVRDFEWEAGEARLKAEERARRVAEEHADELAELKRKRDELTGKLWQKDQALAAATREAKALQAKIAELEAWKRAHHALLVEPVRGVSPGGRSELRVVPITSAEYYTWKADEARFRRERGLAGDYSIVRIGE